MTALVFIWGSHMLNDHKLLISAGAVLATGMVMTATLVSDDPASPCLDHRVAASMVCTTEPIQMADGPENEPEPVQAQHSAAATGSSSSVVHLTARSIATGMAMLGQPALTLSSAA